MPSPSEWTLRLKTPINIPAMSPFMVEPITIPASWSRTAGVNQAVKPSKIPNNPPKINPSNTLFMAILRRCAAKALCYLYYPSNGFSLVFGENNEKDSHDDVHQHQSNGCPVSVNEPGGAIQKVFPVSTNGHLLQIPGNIGGKIANRTITGLNIGSHGLAADCLKLARQGLKSPCLTRFAICKDKNHDCSQGKNVGSLVQ